MSLAIFFSFYRIDFRGRCDSYESHLPLIWTIYFPTAPYFAVRQSMIWIKLDGVKRLLRAVCFCYNSLGKNHIQSSSILLRTALFLALNLILS